MGKQKHSIQSELITWLTGIIVMLYSISAAGIFLFMRHALIEQVDHHLERLAEDFIAETHYNSEGKVESGYHDLGLADYQTADRDTSAFYELWDQNGEPLFKSPSLRDLDLPFAPQSPDFTARTVRLPGDQKGRTIFVTFAPTEKEESPGRGRTDQIVQIPPVKKVHLAMAEGLANLSRILWILATTLALTAAALAAVTHLFVRILVRRACRPMVELGEVTRGISPEQMDVRLPIEQAPSELHPLIVQFNELVARFQDGIIRERRFSIDIAHELRTPLAELQVLMEVGTKSKFPEFEAGSIEDPRVIYENGEAITRRMRKLVGTLTAIYRGENGESEIDIQSVNLAKILGETIAVFPPKDRDRFSCGWTESEEYQLETDPELLRAIFDNLLSNAVVHSPPGSLITIQYQANRVTIENLSCELSPDELSKLDAPFWQKDAARTDPDRFGLGLTMVVVYLRLLKGKISRQLIDETLKTTVTLPDQEG